MKVEMFFEGNKRYVFEDVTIIDALKVNSNEFLTFGDESNSNFKVDDGDIKFFTEEYGEVLQYMDNFLGIRVHNDDSVLLESDKREGVEL